MADNVTLNPGTLGDTIAADDVGGIKYQVVKLAVGADGAASLVANANPVPISDAGGSLTVDGTVAITGVVTEDVASAGAETLFLAGAVRRDTAASSSGTDGDFSTINTDSAGRVWVNASGAAVPVTDNSGSITVDNGGTFQVQVTSISAGNNNIGDVDVASIAAGDNNIGNVDIVTMPNVTLAAGTNTNEVVGDVAHDAAAAGNPVLMGAYASAAAPSDVSGDADAVRLWALRNGSQVVNLAAGGSLIGATSNALDVNIKSGAGSGGTAMADDAAFTVATTSFTPCGGVVTSDSVDSGDGGAFAMLANRQQKVTLYDSGGVELSVGGGTQYTEDAAAAANPVGNALMLVREDARAGSLTTTDGDNVAARGNNKGELYVKHTDAIDVNSHAVTNAGTFLTQENGAALTALQLIDDPVATLGTTTYTETTTKGMIVGAVRRDADTTLVDTTNEVGPLQMDANGRLKVEAFSGETLPVSLASVPSHAVTNAGTFQVQESGSALTALQLIDDPVFADDAAFTIGTSKVMVAGFTADESSTDSLDEGDAGAARITLDRKLIATPYAHAAAGGATPFYNLDADETEDAIKASAGKLYALGAINRSTGVRYLKLYNATTANVTVGSTTPVLVIPLPTMADTNGAGVVLPIPSVGIQFDTAITVAATTGFADADTGAPGTNDVIVFGAYL